jgi:hypothetical protein
MFPRIVVLVNMIFSMSPTEASAFAVPEISYVPSNGPFQRKLLLVNNPEEIHAQPGACDVADALSFSDTACGRSLFRHESVMGQFRNWFEHTNKTGRSLRYGVRLYNPGPNIASVSVEGDGLVTDSVSLGGQEFVQLFNKQHARDFLIQPGKTAWLTSLSEVRPGKFFVGVVDFAVSNQPVILDNLAYFEMPAPVTNPLPFVDRIMGRVREGLVYKGLASSSEAHASNLNFTFLDDTPSGRLTVQYRRFFHSPSSDIAICSPQTTPMCRGEIGSFSSQAELRDHWVTHIAPDPADKNPKRALAVVSDMVSFFVPGLPHGCRPSDFSAENDCFEVSHRYRFPIESENTALFPNLGNWAVHYRVSGVLSNKGSQKRVVHFGLRADGNSPIAYKASNGTWKQKALTKASDSPTDYFPYGEFVVSPGSSVPYMVELVLSGPGAGTLENFVLLLN